MATVEIEVGIRDLKARFSEYLRLVRDGAVVTVTDRGKPVGRLVPVDRPRDERLAAVVTAGIAAWSGHALLPVAPIADVRGDRDVTELLLEDRG